MNFAPKSPPSEPVAAGSAIADAKDHTFSDLRRNSWRMISGQGLAIAFQAIYFVFIGRTLGSKEYGAFVGVASLVSVLGQFSALGMEMILIRDLSRDPKKFAKCWGLALELSVIGFLVVTGVSLIVGHFVLSPEVRPLIPLIAISDVLFAKIALLASRTSQALGDFRLSAGLMALTNGARAIVAGGLFVVFLTAKTHPTAYDWTQVYWISSLLVAVVGFAKVSARYGLPKWSGISGKTLSEGFGFSLASSSVSIYNDIDKTFLIGYGQEKAAGIYSAAYRIVDVASTPVYGIHAAAFPQFFREGDKSVRHARDFSLHLLRKTVPYSVVAALLMFACAPLLPYVFGSSFAQSTSALRWLCLLPLIRCFHYAAGTTITSSASQWYRTTQQLAVAAFNVALNAVLIPRFSWQGAALASLLTDGALAAMNWACVSWLIMREEKTAKAVVSSVV
jgi:O-antigen/teichoic acid export membrane protein